MTDIEALVSETDVYVPAVMRLYQVYLNKNREWLLRDAPRRKIDLRIFEAVFHFNLYMYLKAFFQDIGGDVFPEFPTGNGKVDLMIRRAGKLYALELKSFKDRYAYKAGAGARGAICAAIGGENHFSRFFHRVHRRRKPAGAGNGIRRRRKGRDSAAAFRGNRERFDGRSRAINDGRGKRTARLFSTGVCSSEMPERCWPRV